MSSRRWLLCALSSCLVLIGASRRDRAHGSHPGPLIFNELCALKDEPGPCKALRDRFFFDVNTRRCQLFEYGGCGGNDNNFQSLEECEETCVVSEDKDPCWLPEAPGPCRGLVTRYFFDSRTQRCQHFFYGGCFGNANNFRSLSECQERCQNPGKPTRASEVRTLPASRTTAALPTSVIGDPAVREPEPEPLVQTNTSNLLTADPGPLEPCLSPVDRGSCHGAHKRFAFNPQTRRCHAFSYGGCGGNKNNFLLRKHCLQRCVGVRKGQGRKMIRIRKKNIESIVNRAA